MAHIGGCVFNASTDYYQGAPAPAQQLLGDMACAATITPATLPPNNSAQWATFQSEGGDDSDPDNNSLYGIGIRNNGGVIVWSYFHEYGNGNNVRVDSTVLAVAGVQTTVIPNRDIVAKTIEFIINGVATAPVPYSQNPTGGVNGFFRIGRAFTAGQNILGTVSNAMIWNDKLSGEDKPKYHNIIENGLFYQGETLQDISPAALVSHYPVTGEDIEIDLMGAANLTKNGTPTPVAFSTGTKSPDLGPTTRQGYAWGGTSHFLSDTVALYERDDDASWTLLQSNTAPFAGLSGTPDHIGDPCVDDTHLYAGISNYPSTASNHLVKHLKSDLGRVASVALAADRGTSAVAIDIPNSLLYVSSFISNRIGIYDTDLADVADIFITPYHDKIQGLFEKNGYLYALQDGGAVLIIDPDDGQVVHKCDFGGNWFEYEGWDVVGTDVRALINEGSSVDKVHILTNMPMAVAGGVTLSAADTTQSQLSDPATLAQHYALTALGSGQGQLSDIVGLVEHNLLAVQGSAQVQASEAVVVSENSVLPLSDSAQLQACDAVSLTENSLLLLADSSQNQAGDAAVVTEHQTGTLTMVDTAQLQASALVVLTQHHALVPVDSAQQPFSDTANLTENSLLSMVDSSQLQAGDAVAVTENSGSAAVAVLDTFQTQMSDPVLLFQHNILAALDSSQLQFSDPLLLSAFTFRAKLYVSGKIFSSGLRGQISPLKLNP